MMKNRRRKVPVFGLLFISFILVILLSFMFIWLIVFREYKSWEQDFELDKFSDAYITLENEILKTSLESKLKKFAESNNKIDFVELTDKEFIYLVGESINSSLPLNITFEKGYISSEKGVWDLYVKTNRMNFKLPWVRFRIQKDNTESPELYVSKMSIGNFDFTDYGAKVVLDRVNKGIRDAILLVNQSDFTGRVFRNIELENGKIIIKGEK